MKTIVTTYAHADLDGTACSYAYAELLRKQWDAQAVCAISGTPHREAQFVLEHCGVQVSEFSSEFVPDARLVLVDASDVFGLDPLIDVSRIVEVIDHRRSNDAGRFVNAAVQIEFVGAAATLVYERFKKAGVVPSKSAATLLYGAIVSNTVNFKAKVTTPRDVDAAKELLAIAQLPPGFIHDMFTAKSVISDVADAMEKEFALGMKGDFLWSIIQLEIVEAARFVSGHHGEIVRTLTKMGEQKKACAIFLTCIDVEKGYNVIVCPDPKTRTLLTSIFGWQFKDDLAQTASVMMRKEMVPLLKARLSV